jgi:DNA invertase Pin-like site-specific DNA recombinase
VSRVGYGRVSTQDQNPDSQRDLLIAAGCDPVFVDKMSGKLAARPELDKTLVYLRPGDELVVTRLSRAARSLRHLLELADTLREKQVDLVVLKQGIDTTSPTGRLVFHLLGAIDEFTRELIVEGTHEGLAAARARGRVGGRKPKLSEAQVQLARQLYDETGEDGTRAHTVEEIGAMFGVTRATVYRHLGRARGTLAAAYAIREEDGTWLGEPGLLPRSEYTDAPLAVPFRPSGDANPLAGQLLTVRYGDIADRHNVTGYTVNVRIGADAEIPIRVTPQVQDALHGPHIAGSPERAQWETGVLQRTAADAALPADTRPLPDVTKYDELLPSRSQPAT